MLLDLNDKRHSTFVSLKVPHIIFLICMSYTSGSENEWNLTNNIVNLVVEEIGCVISWNSKYYKNKINNIKKYNIELFYYWYKLLLDNICNYTL